MQIINKWLYCNAVDSVVGTSAPATDQVDYDYMIDIVIKASMAVLIEIYCSYNLRGITKLAPANRVIAISEPKSIPRNVRLRMRLGVLMYFLNASDFHRPMRSI